VIRVGGDSMQPTLHADDDLLVDHDDAAGRLRDGIYVLRTDDTLLVKRLSVHPVGRRLTIQSDNPAYGDLPDIAPDQVHLIGRVVWAGRRIV
jgi:phage repressor protein C with HTH and peptisase S24 domain